MKKRIISVISALLIAGGACALWACSGGNDGGTTPPAESQQPEQQQPEQQQPEQQQPEQQPTLKKIEGLSLADGTHGYDGQAHPLSVAGTLPDGAEVRYSENNNSADAGTYAVTATVTCTGYETLNLNATLTINKAVMTGLQFPDATYPYDGSAHGVELIGQPPQGSSVTYACAENSSVKNSATETGSYTITVTVTNKNYAPYTATATLIITASEKDRYICSHGGKLYFGNALDGDKLYSYSTSGGVVKVSGDIPYNFTEMGGELYFRSYTALASSVKTVTASADKETAKTVISEKGEYLCTDGTTLYFAVNALTAAKSGIYKIDLSGEEPEAVLLSAGKAKYLTYYGGNLYFADGSNGNKLSKMSVDGGARSLVVDEKITCLTQDGGALYYTVDNLTGNYIEKYTLSSYARRKLTSDAGANLTVIGNKLYYINVDLLNSYLFGKGVYSVNTGPLVDNSLPGTKVIGEENESYSSLTKTSDGKLAYYRVSDQMLCVSDANGGNTLEVLDGFVAPEYEPVSTGSKTLAYGKTLYFLDLYNDKALYSYDTVTKAVSRITSNKVADFAILGDKLFYNAISYGVNNDLYRIDLKLGGEAELVSKYDCEDIVTDGSNIYYVYSNIAGARTAIHKIDAQGVDSEMYSKGATNLTYYEDYIYFVDGKDLLKMPTVGYELDTTITVTDKNVDVFVIDDGVIYFRETYRLGANKRLARVNIDGTGYQEMMTANTDPLKIVVVGNTIYYYTDTVLGTSGIYSISKNAADDKEKPKLILARNNGEKTYYAEDFTVLDGKIYFVNYYNLLGDSHLYAVNIANGQVEKIA